MTRGEMWSGLFRSRTQQLCTERQTSSHKWAISALNIHFFLCVLSFFIASVVELQWSNNKSTERKFIDSYFLWLFVLCLIENVKHLLVLRYFSTWAADKFLFPFADAPPQTQSVICCFSLFTRDKHICKVDLFISDVLICPMRLHFIAPSSEMVPASEIQTAHTKTWMFIKRYLFCGVLESKRQRSRTQV